MTPTSSKKDLFFLSILTFLAGAMGIFWGVDFRYHGPFVFPHTDESTFTKGAIDFINFGTVRRPDYFYGFLGELLPWLYGIKSLSGQLSRIQVLFTGRIVNLCFSVGNVWLVYYLTNKLVNNRQAARVAAIILSIAPLHAAMSHHCTPLASFVFWSYASLISSFIFCRTQNALFFFLACFTSGAAIAVKFGFLTLIPIFYHFFLFFRKKPLLILGFVVVTISFFVFNCGLWPWQHTRLFEKLIPGNFYMREYQRLLNPLVYFIGLLPGLGLFPMILVGIGFAEAVKDGFYNFLKVSDVRDRFFCLEIPLLAQFIVICFMTSNFIRHTLFLFPYLALLGGIGGVQLYQMLEKKSFKKIAAVFLGLALVYQMVSVFWMESRYLLDPFFSARHWFMTRSKSSEKIWMGGSGTFRFASGNLFPHEKIVERLENADYFLLLETVRMITARSFLTPLTNEPGPSQWYYWKNSNDPAFIRQVIRGQTEFRPAAHFHLREIIPEFYLYRKWLGIFAPTIPNPGDVTIYQKRLRDNLNV